MGVVINMGVGLETWGFDACGERFLEKGAPAKQAPPLASLLPTPTL